jgi:hypothetical protein
MPALRSFQSLFFSKAIDIARRDAVTHDFTQLQQDLGHDTAGGLHAFDFTRGLQINHPLHSNKRTL